MTIVGIYPNNKGAFVYYHKEKVPKIKNLQQRLWKEVEMAVELASFLREEYSLEVEAIDFDLNSKEEYASSRLSASAIGYAKANGFEGCCKPDVLYSVYAADFIANHPTVGDMYEIWEK